MIDQARQMENASHVAGGLVQRRAAAVVRGAMTVTVLVLIVVGTSVVVALALSGCGTDLFPPADVSTETADAGLPIGRLRIETSDGVFVLYDAAVPKDVADRTPAYVAWWNDFAAREMFVFDRLIETQGDVGHALLNLERDLEIDLDSLIDDNPALIQAIEDAAAQSEDTTEWQPATYALAMDIMGFDAPDPSEADAVDVVLFAEETVRPCIQMKSIILSLGPLESLAEPLKAVTFAVNVGCGGAGPPPPPPDCPGDIDCDGIPNGEDDDIDGDGILNGDDPDVDGDGILNGDDPDVDGDGIPNGFDPDVDGDGIPNGDDPDVDGDGIPNGDDPDVDGDGIPNGDDPDVDGDGIPNGDDPDVDGDGIPNGDDPDVDGDGIPNADDPDTDGDGLPDEDDSTPGGCTTDCAGACCTKSTGVCRMKKKSECLGPLDHFNGFDVVCNPNPCCQPGTNPTFPPGSATVSWQFRTIPDNDPKWGSTGIDALDVMFDVVCDGTQWCAVLTRVSGVYFSWYRLLPNTQEVTGPPPGNTTKENNCLQATDLKNLRKTDGGWFMLRAVRDHENVHVAHMLPTLQAETPSLEGFLEAVCVAHTPGMTVIDAIDSILESQDYQCAMSDSLHNWKSRFAFEAIMDHQSGGPTEQAEHAVVDPIVSTICSFNKSQCWPVCNACPARETGACCAPETGVCNIKTDCDCVDGGGEYRGDDITCGPPNPCQGVCCVPGSNACQVASEWSCTNVLNGTYNGDGTTCAMIGCGPPE